MKSDNVDVGKCSKCGRTDVVVFAKFDGKYNGKPLCRSCYVVISFYKKSKTKRRNPK